MSGCTFKAIVPSIGTAIKIHGDGGWRVQFDIGVDQEAAALELLTMRGVVLEVTVRPEQMDSKNEHDQAIGRRSAKRRK